MQTSSVFTYGTLQIQVVVKAVTGQSFIPVPARLTGYQRLKIKNKTYPGIIQNPDYSIEGILYRNLDRQSMLLIDEFEDVCYERVLVDILVKDKKEKAFVYVIKDKNNLCNEEWSLEEFKKKYLKLYLKRISER